MRKIMVISQSGIVRSSYNSSYTHKLMKKYLHKIIQGDCLKIMKELPDKSGKILIGGLYVKKDAVKDVHKKLRVTVEVLE